MRALIFHGPGDLRLEDVPRPGAGPGRRPRPGRGRAHRRHRREGVPPRAPAAARPAAEPVRPRVLRDRRRDRPARGRGELRAVRRLRAVPPRRGDALREPAPAAERRLRRATCSSRSGSPAATSSPSRRPRARGRRARRAARLLPARRRARGDRAGDTVAILGAGPIGLMLCACVADAGGRPVVVGGRARAARAGARCSAQSRAGERRTS